MRLFLVSASQGITVKQDMEVLIEPAGIASESYGSIQGVIKSVQQFPVSKQSIMSMLHNEELAKKIINERSKFNLSQSWFETK